MDEDVEAYLNRMHIVWLTDNWIYYHMAMSGDANVPRMAWPDPQCPDIFVPEVRDILKKYKKDQTYRPPNFAADFEWGVELLGSLSMGAVPLRTMTIKGPDIVNGGTMVQYIRPCLSTRKDGIAFIKEMGPVQDARVYQEAWTDEQIRKANSPIYKWDKATVLEKLTEEAQRSVAVVVSGTGAAGSGAVVVALAGEDAPSREEQAKAEASLLKDAHDAELDALLMSQEDPFKDVPAFTVKPEPVSPARAKRKFTKAFGVAPILAIDLD